MGLYSKLLAGSSSLGFSGTTPTINPGATSLSKLHANGDQPSYSLNGANFSEVNAAYTEYRDGVNNALPQPSYLDLNGLTPSRYIDHLPE